MMICRWFPRFSEKGLIVVMLAAVTSISLTGCDYWPPALQDQIDELLADLNDALDEQQRLDTVNRELRAPQASLEREVEEKGRDNEALHRRLDELTKRQPQATVVKRVSVAQSKPTRTTVTKGAPPLLRLTQPPMRGKRVTRLQQLLQRHELPIRVDGIYGRDTAAAVRGFQRSRGLPADGVVRPATERALRQGAESPKLVRRLQVTRPPLKGRDVMRVQQALRRAGYRLMADGRFGPQTKRAVIRFQRKRGLSPDGVVGPQTWATLMTTP